jgi:hypothetical protein
VGYTPVSPAPTIPEKGGLTPGAALGIGYEAKVLIGLAEKTATSVTEDTIVLGMVVDSGVGLGIEEPSDPGRRMISATEALVTGVPIAVSILVAVDVGGTSCRRYMRALAAVPAVGE